MAVQRHKRRDRAGVLRVLRRRGGLIGRDELCAILRLSMFDGAYVDETVALLLAAPVRRMAAARCLLDERLYARAREQLEALREEQQQQRERERAQGKGGGGGGAGRDGDRDVLALLAPCCVALYERRATASNAGDEDVKGLLQTAAEAYHALGDRSGVADVLVMDARVRRAGELKDVVGHYVSKNNWLGLFTAFDLAAGWTGHKSVEAEQRSRLDGHDAVLRVLPAMVKNVVASLLKGKADGRGRAADLD